MLHSLLVLYAKVNGWYVEFAAPQPCILYSFHKLAGNFTESKFPEAKYFVDTLFPCRPEGRKKGMLPPEEHPLEHPLLCESISV